MKHEEITFVLKAFGFVAETTVLESFGSGHINDTFKLTDGNESYILQRINHLIFTDVEGLMANMQVVTQHLLQQRDSLLSFEVLPTKDNELYYLSEEGNYWRMITLIPEARSFDRVQNTEMAYQGGKGYGMFLKALHDFPVDELVETLPDFHNARFRIAQFEEAVANNKANRLVEVTDLVNTLLARKEEMMQLQVLREKGELPLRVTHNDTKINNILFDHKLKPLAVVDLDTVMPGLAHYDFGDAIRTFTNPADEDEQDLSKVQFKLDYYHAFAEGYLSETKDILTPTEIKYLPLAAQYIVYEQCIRFLGDYLNGDSYYKTQYDKHNLVRAKVQFALLEGMRGKI
jgi:Ser/Thr protein kinase RdoA (MazF antagonist)